MRSGSGAAPQRASLGGYLATGWEGLIVLLIVAFLVTSTLATLLAWQAAAILYLAVGWVVVNRDVGRGSESGRTGVLGTLSWVLPVASSVSGIYSAVLALAAGPSAAGERLVLTVSAVVGIVVAWLLLHTGLAQSYQADFEAHPDEPGLDFPRTSNPMLLDFLYFSFAIGAAFATSDTRIQSRRTRRIVLLHSVVSFFYNAFVIAIAFQVLQQIVGN